MVMQRIAPEIERVCLTIDGGPGDTLGRSRRDAPSWTAGLDVDDFGGSVPRMVAGAGCAVWSPPYRNVSASVLAEATSIGLKVIPWTVNERPDMERLIALGVDGIITDYPDRLRALMIDKGMPVPPAVAVR
jgi:glycerophosphoryl diester phosphodiesterase